MPRHPRIETQFDFDREIEMMSHSDHWPLLCLPVKRWVETIRKIEVGIITAPLHGPTVPTVFPGNIYSGADGDPLKYDSFEAIVEDGWVVD